MANSLTISASTGLIVNGGTVNVGIASAGNLVSSGLITVLNGTLNVGQGQNRIEIVTGTGTFTGGTVNVFGKFTLTAGTTTINGSAINIDPQATSSLAATSHIFEAVGAASVTFSSGSVTIIDPHASTGTGNAVQIVSGVGTKNFTGSTIRLGDGSSTTPGTTDGFDINGSATDLLGNIVVNNPSGTNRSARLITNDLALTGNLTITAGTLNANSKYHPCW